jgi:hypothetical protein
MGRDEMIEELAELLLRHGPSPCSGSAADPTRGQSQSSKGSAGSSYGAGTTCVGGTG